jgi:phosphohistidine phosphatase
VKRLAVLRHATSGAGEPDFERRLNDSGWNEARRLGGELKRCGMQFDLCLASPAARVRETLEGVAEGYGELPFPVRLEPRIYEASVGTLIGLIRELAGGENSVLLVGHNPGLQRLLLELSSDDGQGHRDRVARTYSPAALAVIKLAVEVWEEVEPGSGTIVECLEPADFD